MSQGHECPVDCRVANDIQYNVLHCRQEDEPRPQVICTENFAKFGHVVFEICQQRDRHTDDRHADTDRKFATLRTAPDASVKIISSDT